jgi:hypothetical protein
MYTTPVNGYWRHMGWGQPGVGPNNVVHYAYADRPGTGDPGNIKYIRSTDNGTTWSAPIQLNTDTTTRAQWMPSLAVNSAGAVFVSWYDERRTTGDNLERWGRASTDNGVTWQTDDVVSDVAFPKPLQPDPGIQPCYAGDYDYATFSNNGSGTNALTTWTDGRVLINGQPQQDVFFDKVFVVTGAPTPTPMPPTPTPVPPTPTPTPLPGTMHIGDLDGLGVNVGHGSWQARVTITVHSSTHGPVSSATITGSWGGSFTGTSSCVTNIAGQCTVSTGDIRNRNRSVTFTVNGVTHSSLTYNPKANHDPDGDSNGTVITVTR